MRGRERISREMRKNVLAGEKGSSGLPGREAGLIAQWYGAVLWSQAGLDQIPVPPFVTQGN